MVQSQVCLVIGGAGFIGSHVVDSLTESGYVVRVLDLPRRNLSNIAHLSARIELVEGDFLNETDLKRAMEGVDVIFHLVGTTLPQSSNDNPIYDVETNLISTLRLLHLARQIEPKRIVFVSSGGTVYGLPETVPVAETHPTFPISAYGISKLAIEKYLHLYHHLYGLDYVVLRVSNPYGERQQSIGAQQGVVSVFLNRLLRDETIDIWGDGSVVRDFLYIRDVARAFTLALNHVSPYRIFNVGSGVGLSLNQLLVTVAHVTGLSPRVNYLPSRATDVPSNVLDITRIRSEWGWEPHTTLVEGLERTWQWLKRQ